MMTTSMRILAFMVATILSTTAFAHDGMGPHGGRLADTGTHHLELVMMKDKIDVFVSNKASVPIVATHLKGFAIVVANGASTRIALTAAGDDKLVGQATVPLPDQVTSVVQVQLADGQTIQARFD